MEDYSVSMAKNVPSRRLLRLFESCTSLTSPRIERQILKPNLYDFESSNAMFFHRHIGTSAPSNEEKIRTHYTLFPLTFPAGPPPDGPFQFDLSHLKKEFRQLQYRAHPDHNQGATRSRAEVLSASINDAYKTLQHPLLRAQYLLSLRGIDIADYTGDDSDKELVKEVLRVRERMEDIETEEQFMNLQEENAARIKTCEEKLSIFFAQDDLRRARSEVGELRYWCSIEEALKDLDEVLRGFSRGNNIRKKAD